MGLYLLNFKMLNKEHVTKSIEIYKENMEKLYL